MKKNDRIAIDGVFLLDKSTGITSNSALQRVKRIFNAKKAGHTGALDPLATGLLPICFGEATKFSQFLLDSVKSYRVSAQLGVRTTTSDSEGDVISRRPVDISLNDIKEKLPYFLGNVMQKPTMYSALKYQGQPLYKYARAGIHVDVKARPITIYKNTLLNYENNILELDITCSKGTYIRTVIDDLGQLLECGAHVIALRRTGVAHYQEEDMMTLEALENQIDNQDKLLQPIDSMLVDLPIVSLSLSQSDEILCGQRIVLQDNLSLHQCYRIYQQYGTSSLFLGIGQCISEGVLAPKRLVNLS